MTAGMLLRITCDYCDTQILLPVREAVDGAELLQQVRQHSWTERADGHSLQHLCPCCVELLEDLPPEEAW